MDQHDTPQTEAEITEAETPEVATDTETPTEPSIFDSGMFVVLVGRPPRRTSGHRTVQEFIDSEWANIHEQLERHDPNEGMAAKARLLTRLQGWADRDAALTN